MNAPNPPGLNPELLDDFFAEADEHLLGIRQGLLRFEPSVGKAQADPKIVEELFHDFHSFKGISAIVGLASAEELAHAAEDFLRLMRGGKGQLTAKGLELLTASIQKLEQIVSSFRQRKPLPGHASVLADLKQGCELLSSFTPATKPGSTGAILSETGNSSDTSLLTSIEEAKARGLLLWKYTFSPSHELNARGVNINTIRAQLAAFAEILKSTPVIKSQGVINFEFLVATRETPTDIADWEARGVTIQIAAEAESGRESKESPQPSIGDEDIHSPFLAPSHVVRVDLKRLDDLMRIAGEMVIHRSRLDAQLAKLNRATGRVDLAPVREVSGNLGRSVRELREAIMRVRLVPVAEIFARMPFVVRDLSRQAQKKVALKLEGQEILVDKYLIERLKDPLLHLVRNAFSHGIEAPADRARGSKAEEGTIELIASTSGDSVIIQVRDDGRGINPNAIAQRARKLGLEVPDVLDSAAILKILCASGFSTRDDADRTSGRGVGMAVVQSTLRELGGNLALQSEEGRGTQFTLRVPLTLAIAEVLVVRSAGQTCAVLQSFVREILHTNEAEIQRANGIEVIPHGRGVLPVVRLAEFFGLTGIIKPIMYLLVIESDRGSVGLLAEDILGQREIVVRALQDPLIQVPGIVGATELGDGKPVLILDGEALTAGNVRPPETPGSPG